MALNFTISPLYRINGQELSAMPGLLALAPPRAAARGREQDRLIVYLLLTGNAVFTTSEYKQFAEDAAKVFYAASGSQTSALKAAAEATNQALLARNMETSSRGQYTIGWLALGALRDSQITFLLCGPMRAFYFGQNETRHIFEPNVSGKGLGMNQRVNIHYAQTPLQLGDRLMFCGKVPVTWQGALKDATASSLEALRRRLSAATTEDLNAVIMQTSNGAGEILLLSGALGKEEKPDEKIAEKAEEKPTPPARPESLPRREEPASAPQAHVVQPAAYALPEKREESKPNSGAPASLPRTTGFPASIPRASSQTSASSIDSVFETLAQEPETTATQEPIAEEKITEESSAPREPSLRARRAAKNLAGGIQFSRKLSDAFGERLKNFLPRLLPNAEPTQPELVSPSNFSMLAIALVVPLMVVVVLMVVYFKYGRSQQYETYFYEARQKREQAVLLTDPIEQRKSWEAVLTNVLQAEEHGVTDESLKLRQEANGHLDSLLGITRLQYNPVFSSNLGISISRLAASETDLFMLDAESGGALRAQLTNSAGFQLDASFNCKPGVYGEYTVGPLVDILAMPTLTTINATLLGVDASGNLLYCAPGETPRAIPLPVPDTNWGRVTAISLDAGNLYVLDAPSRAVWVYVGKDGNFIDRPYFFFNEQTPTQDVIDMLVSGNELYMLHADGHISNCSYNRIETNPQKCKDPFPLVNPFQAYQDQELFAAAHFTQMLFAAPPDPSILLLDADTQSVLRFTPRSLELQNQYRPAANPSNLMPSAPADAVAVSPNHYLFIAVRGQIYVAQTP